MRMGKPVARFSDDDNGARHDRGDCERSGDACGSHFSSLSMRRTPRSHAAGPPGRQVQRAVRPIPVAHAPMVALSDG